MNKYIWLSLFFFLMNSSHATETKCEKLNAEVQLVGGSSSALISNVIGVGRAHFYSAPGATCLGKRFLIPGDLVTVYSKYKEWFFVMFTNSKTGENTRGWLQESRLKITEKTSDLNQTQNTKSLSENGAIDLVNQKIQQDSLYGSWTKINCLSFLIEEATNAYFDVAIRAKNDGSCSGDPNTAPIVDRFRVLRLTKKILWYDVVNDEYVDYEQVKKQRK